MYDDLVKRMRVCISDTEDCAGCPYQGGYKETYCTNGLITEAADAIEEMKREIERMVVFNASNTLNNDAMRWIPVTERLPLYGQDVLAVRTYWDGEKCQEVLMAHIAVWNEGTDEKWWNATNITHWMPLPEPPKEVDDEWNK